MKKERLQVVILILIIMFGVSYAYVKFLFLPQWEVIQGGESRLASLENQYQELLNYQENDTKLAQEIKTYELKIQQLNTQLPRRLDKPQLVYGLYTLAKNHGVNPQSVSFEQMQDKGTYQEIGMSFSCIGKAKDILILIHDLQFGKNLRIALKSVSLTGSQENMQAELRLIAYASSSEEPDQKSEFMNSSFGVDSPEKMF